MEIENLKAYMRGSEWAIDEQIKGLEKKILTATLQPEPDRKDIDLLCKEHYKFTGIRDFIRDILDTFPELKTK